MNVAGLVYLQGIGQVRTAGSALLSYELLRGICGPIALGTTVMASILHNSLAGSIQASEPQEREALALGAVYKRVNTDDPKRDTENIVDHILEKYKDANLVNWDRRVADGEERLREMLETHPKTQDPVSRRLIVVHASTPAHVWRFLHSWTFLHKQCAWNCSVETDLHNQCASNQCPVEIGLPSHCACKWPVEINVRPGRYSYSAVSKISSYLFCKKCSYYLYYPLFL
jgi:hypothetical protein